MRAHPRGTPTKATAPSPRAAYPGTDTPPKRSRKTGTVTALTPERTAQATRLATTRRPSPRRTERRSTRLRVSRSPIAIRPEPRCKPAPGPQPHKTGDQQTGADELERAPGRLGHVHSPRPQLPHRVGLPTGRAHLGVIIRNSLIPWLCRGQDAEGGPCQGPAVRSGIRSWQQSSARVGPQWPARAPSAGSRRRPWC